MAAYVYKCLFRDRNDNVFAHVHVKAAGDHPFEDIRRAAFDIFSDYLYHYVGPEFGDMTPEEILFSITSIDVVAGTPIYG